MGGWHRDDGVRMRLLRSFGEPRPGETPCSDDVLSAVAFDAKGANLAVGDEGGRVVLFASDGGSGFDYASEFQAQEAKVDHLRSTPIPAAVTALGWSPWGVVASSEREVALWSVRGKKPRRVRELSRAHTYRVHSVSASADGETLLSADDLRLNLWRADRAGPAFTALDLRPDDMVDLEEVMTVATFHPRDGHGLLYATSTGRTATVDLRAGALAETGVELGSAIRQRSSSASSFGDPYDAVTEGATDARYAGVFGVLVRDFFTLTLWDLRRPIRPVARWDLHEDLRPHVHALHKSQAIYERFGCACDGAGRIAVTGLFGNAFSVADALKPHEPPRRAVIRGGAPLSSEDGLCTGEPVLAMAHHPSKDLIAVATTYALSIFEGVAAPPP